MAWIEAAPYKKLQRLERMVISAGEQEMILMAVQDKVYAFQKSCPHRGFTLENARFNSDTEVLSCQFHGWEFGLDQEGKCINAGADLKTYPVKIEADKVWVDVDSSKTVVE